MYIAVFILNGCVSIVSKIHQIETVYKSVSSVEFIIWGGIFKFFIAGILWLICKKREGNTIAKGRVKKSILIIALSAAAGGASYFLQLDRAKTLPATVLYPFITGGSIVLSALWGRVAFKESLSRRIIISIILCFIGTIMFL